MLCQIWFKHLRARAHTHTLTDTHTHTHTYAHTHSHSHTLTLTITHTLIAYANVLYLHTHKEAHTRAGIKTHIHFINIYIVIFLLAVLTPWSLNVEQNLWCIILFRLVQYYVHLLTLIRDHGMESLRPENDRLEVIIDSGRPNSNTVLCFITINQSECYS